MECPVQEQKQDRCPVNSHGARNHVESEVEPLPDHLPELARLGSERQRSSIPMPDADNGPARWTYPSERMFYNALRRKGYEPDTDDIGPMLLIHNHLNEQVWQEVLRWERLRDPACSLVSLDSFHGLSTTLSPKARFLCRWLKLAPLPFDRHDWYVQGCDGSRRRYIIDYYPGPDDTSFHCDIRPALDDLPSVWHRVKGLLSL